MPESWIAAILKNFSLAMFIVSVIFILFHRAIKRGMPEAEIGYRWVVLFALGFTSI